MATMNSEVNRVMRTIFRRCVTCEDVPLSCPTCPTGQSCSFTTKTCDACPGAVCIPNPEFNPDDAPAASSGPNIGAIAGGVVGGIIFMAFVTWLLWRFWLKKRRQQIEQELDDAEWSQTDLPPEKRQSQFTMRRDARMSTHTVASMASTVLTRASNIIQIAYIPGITNRSGPQSPDLLVPPVPPIPLALNNSQPNSPYSQHEDSHYFMPGDLRSVRDSTFSGYTDRSDNRSSFHTIATDNRSSFHTMHSRHSITPSLARSSIATTIYRNDAAADPMPATTVLRGKAAMVSVKSSGSGSPLGTPTPGTPPVPSIDYSSIQRPPIQIRMPSNQSLRSSAQSSAVSAASARPVPVTITKKKPSLISMNSSSSLRSDTSATASTARPPTVNSFATESEVETGPRQSLVSTNTRDSGVTEIVDTPAPTQSPFADMSATIASPRHQQRSTSRIGGLDSVAESDEPSHIARSRSPFGDEHEVR